MNKSENAKAFPCQLARVGWVAGVIAVVLISATARSSGRVTGELIVFLFIGVGTIASVVSLAMIAKFGARGLLWPALGGMAINGLLLAIAIPNLLQSRPRAIENKSSGNQVEARETALPSVANIENRDDKQTTNWRRYRIGGLEIMSPFGLTKSDAVASFQRTQKSMHLSSEQSAAAEENAKRMEVYSGAKAGFSVSFHGRTLLPAETILTESMASQITGALRQKFPQGFRSNSRVVTIAGQQATRITIQCQIEAKTARAEYFIILGQSNLWQIQIFGPADLAQYDKNVEMILKSAKFL